ncbi:MAG TPA: hypothetical protein VFT65_00235, partial [Candidatus Angelobacter sp.]|nr:hypothetical protein [Candidatus Angelobacter sp.]
KFSSRPLMSRFKTWNSVPLCLLEYARKHGLDAEWKDVMDIIAAHGERRRRAGIPFGTTSVTPARSRMLVNQPLYGTPLGHPAMTYAPTNEQGVVLLFGAMAVDLGYAVNRLQTECPDCEATRRVGRDRCQRARIEFEFESRNFLLHLHRLEDCDLIVCWEHNWPECPLEVLSLKEVLEKSGKYPAGRHEQEQEDDSIPKKKPDEPEE